jgi:hypothetical protein
MNNNTIIDSTKPIQSFLNDKDICIFKNNLPQESEKVKLFFIKFTDNQVQRFNSMLKKINSRKVEVKENMIKNTFSSTVNNCN